MNFNPLTEFKGECYTCKKVLTREQAHEIWDDYMYDRNYYCHDCRYEYMFKSMQNSIRSLWKEVTEHRNKIRFMETDESRAKEQDFKDRQEKLLKNIR